MKTDRRTVNLIRCCAVLLVAALCCALPGAAWEFNVNPISTNNYMDISTSNGGGYYVGFRNAGGGLNAIHITTTTSDPYGQLTSVSSDTGTFYLADTGGRGYFDRAILMVAIKVPGGGKEKISENLTIRLRASGYRWTSEGIKDQPPHEENITYVTDSLNRVFGLSSVKYGPQSWKPAGEEGHSITAGQSSTDEFYLFFVETGVGILGGNSGITGLTDNGMAKIDYTIANYNGETIVFNVYGYALWADAVKDGIAWTNKIDGTVTDKNVRTGASGYSVLLGSSGGSGEFGGSTAIDYSDSGTGTDSISGVWKPAVGNLNITSSPAGALVFLDGVDTGRVTNASFADLPEAEYTIRLALPGYDPLERTGIRVRGGYVTGRHFDLTPAMGSCTVLSDVRGARIYVDGNETLYYANWTFQDLEVGRHTISLAKNGYDPVWREVIVDETNGTVVFLGMSGSGGEEIDTGSEPTPGGSRYPEEQPGTEPEEKTRTESVGFFELLLSFIAGLFGGADTGSQPEGEAAVYEHNSPDDDAVFTAAAYASGQMDGNESEALPEQVTVQAARTGSVYVTSNPPDSGISIDGKDTGYTTPHLVYGLKAGAHTVTVKKEKTGTASRTVVVPLSDSTVADFNLMGTDSRDVTIHVTSKGFSGGNVSPNGEPPSFGLPAQVMVDASWGYLTYTDGEKYYTRALPALGGGETVVLQKEDATGTINVTSMPDGADIYIDGVRTGYKTPCIIGNAGYGRHNLVITKAGCLPAKREILLADTGDAIDTAQHFILEEIATGMLTVTSSPPGCMVYLRGVYTGETTPCTFAHIPIGTYNVGVMFSRTQFMEKDVTVSAGVMSNITVDIEDG